MPLEPIVLGHNAFFGVDHLSARRGRQRAIDLASAHRVVNLVDEARAIGIHALMLSTHPYATDICREIRRRRSTASDLRIYPLLPYAQKYVTRANEMGLLRAALATLRQTSVRQRVSLGADFARLVARRDALDIVRALIRIELGVFRRLEMHVVFLHDAMADLMLALDLPRVFETYERTIQRWHGTRAGLATKNLPFALRRFHEWGMAPPVFLTHVNSAGFQMNPGRDSCDEVLSREDLSVMAMGVLASGHIAPAQAFEYIAKHAAVTSVCVGMSQVAHLRETFELASKALRRE